MQVANVVHIDSWCTAQLFCVCPGDHIHLKPGLVSGERIGLHMRAHLRRAAVQLALEGAAATDGAAHQLDGVSQARREGCRPVHAALNAGVALISAPDLPLLSLYSARSK